MTSRKGLLSDYFMGVVAKRLSAVEADATRSNQHEYNGVQALKNIFGLDQPRKYPARFVWLGDEQEAVSEDGFVTWYDARANHPTRSEYRLYFPTTPVSEMASEGDTLLIAKRTNDTVLVIIVPSASTIQAQLFWLFGIDAQPGLDFESQPITEDTSAELDFAATFVLDEIGIEYEEPETDLVDQAIERFGLSFPPTRELSKAARATLPDVSPIEDPDRALVLWMEREEQLFRRLERRIVASRLETGFASDGTADVDGFLGFSLSVQNRRKARAGFALENHIEALLTACRIRFDRGAETENRNKPDFLFPGRTEYIDASFPSAALTMLGAKSTLKDRWRQVLSEASRIETKHLLTLEPSVSTNQTDEMQAKSLQLVVPTSLHSTFKPTQRDWLMTVASFVLLVRSKQ